MGDMSTTSAFYKDMYKLKNLSPGFQTDKGKSRLQSKLSPPGPGQYAIEKNKDRNQISNASPAMYSAFKSTSKKS